MRKIIIGILTIGVTLLTLTMLVSTIAHSTPLIISFIVVTLYVVSVIVFQRKGIYIIVGFYAISIVVFFKVFLNDTYYFLHELSLTLANERFLFLHTFEHTSKYEGGFFVSVVALLLVALIFKAVQQRNRILFIAIVMLTLILQMILKTGAPILVSIAFFVIVFLTLLYMNHSLQYKAFIYITTVIVLLFVGMTGLLHITNTGASVQQAMQMKLDNWRFNSNTTQSPNGSLTNSTKLSKSDQAALKVVMEKPEPVYLKGFIGAQFQASSWQHLDGEIYLQSKSLLDSLHQHGFNSYNQFSLAANEIQKDDDYKMSVQNVDADRRYGYTPYEATIIDDELSDLDGIGVTANNWRGASSYELAYSPIMIQQYPKVAAALYSQKDSEYLNMESYYNEFVYTNYLQIANADRLVLTNHFTANEEDMTYEKAIELVQTFLKENLQYKEQTESVTSLQQLLEETKSGYSPHYATVATLLFRFMHIPARYVEGYIVTKQDVQNKEAYSELPIAQKNAHTWTEIYIDTVGWVPIEVTPGYEERMPQIDMDGYPAFEGTASTMKTDQAAGVTQTQTVKDEKITDEKPTPEVVNQHTRYWLVILILFLLGMAAFALYKKIKRNRYLHAGNANVKAIHYWTILLYMLERELNISLSDLQTVSECMNEAALQSSLTQSMYIYEKAKYSGHVISEEEFEIVKQAFVAIKKAIYKNKKLIYKAMMLWRY